MAAPKIAILDGYVDEPANFGVPPFVSPHARYLAGAAKAAHPEASVRYLTIDEHRRSLKSDALREATHLVLIAGALVPGKYLRGSPISFREASALLEEVACETMIAGSTALYGFGQGGGKAPLGRAELDRLFTYRARLHADALLFDILSGHATRTSARTSQRKRTMDEWRRWSVAGAFVVRDHPDLPNPLIAEVDTYHGCVRYVNGGCAFCMEPKEGRPVYRPVSDVVAEVAALAAQGVRSFRIGGQACFYSYQAKGLGETPTPEPNPEAIRELLIGIRASVPKLHALHLDNVDPAVVAAHPEASAEVTKLIVEHMTDGNIAAFGLESADPAVKRAENLNADPEIVFRAAEILNRYGRRRGARGFPAFLPGLNFLCGLRGESGETYELNEAFLREYRRRGLWARRINIRKVVVNGEEVRVDQGRFLKFKEFVRQEIDQPMLREMLPPGTVLRDVWVETNEGAVTFGRPIGSYAMLVGVPYPVLRERFVDVAITDYGYRSVTGIVVPFDVNHAPLKALEALPGVGKRRAVRIAAKRPFRDAAAVARALDDEAAAKAIEPFLGFN